MSAVHIPPGVTDVLDVGIGYSISAKDVAKQGYRVTAISSDEVQLAYAKNILNNTSVVLENIAYKNLRRIHKYDLIMFLESSEVIPVNGIFGYARDLLRDEKWVSY